MDWALADTRLFLSFWGAIMAMEAIRHIFMHEYLNVCRKKWNDVRDLLEIIMQKGGDKWNMETPQFLNLGNGCTWAHYTTLSTFVYI